jgi:putative DNA methylase
MPRTVEFREYWADHAAVFRKTNEEFGGLSNMAPGFPVRVNGHPIRTSEALYQACRFPHMPEVQQMVIKQQSPMTAKMKSKPYRRDSRTDWDSVRVTVMRWCLRVKLAQNWLKFSRLLESTDELPIVEESKKDDFWGAKPIEDGRLVGANVLGRLLMELRQLLREQPKDSLTVVDPPRIPEFLLFGLPIARVGSDGAVAAPMATTNLFEHADHVVEPPSPKPRPEPTLETRTEMPPMTDFPRLIEHAFPLKQASLDSVHEKNVRHGHISTLHIWPARRPLAACRAALIATLLPDPGDAEKRKALCERIGGRVVKKVEKKKMPGGQTVERVKEETLGGILHWLESEPDKSNKKKWREWKARSDHYNAELEWFRQEIRKAYGGRAPKVLDPFAGGGAIPLEAMRLGCEATAVDINPVAWFILKCTLEYPQKLAGQTRPLPDFILHDDAFMADFFKKAKGYSKAETTAALKRLHASIKKKTKPGAKQADAGLPFGPPEGADEEIQADLAWHVRAWGQWVLARARKELAQYYPTYADFEPLKKDQISYERQPMTLVPLAEDGTPDIESLNTECSDDYLADGRNPRWVAKPTVAYLWARTVSCKNCRAKIPLLKTRWICKKDKKRILLQISPTEDRTGVEYSVESGVPAKGGNTAQRREHDRKIAAGTMSRAGAKCPCCPAIMTMEDIRTESNSGRSGCTVFAVVSDGPRTREYRQPTQDEKQAIESAIQVEESQRGRLPEQTLGEEFAPASTRSISAQLYGVRKWMDLFTPRQRLAMYSLGAQVHAAAAEMPLDDTWRSAVTDYLCLGLDRLACFLCVNTRWKTDADSMTDAFSRFSISLLWDFAEANPLGTTAGGYIRCNDRIATALDTLLMPHQLVGSPNVHHGSAAELNADEKLDLIITDPPYYQAVSYADLSDFFYTWLRGFQPRVLPEFAGSTTEKSKEFVQHIREDKKRETERVKYESQMEEAFTRARQALADTGRFVCVFAHKEPDAWETLASAIVRAGFVVTGSWPVQTEMPSRQRGAGVAALASSVWLICRPRPTSARPGWDNRVLEEMRENIAVQLREFWDAGIRGPDFVWAATGPALEAYSKHPVVRKANEPNSTMSVGEFLNHVRRMVVDYIVGQVLTGEQGADMSAADRLDEVTAYYLLHRHDFGLDEAPVGACILYATACGLSDSELERTWDILSGGGKASSTPDEFEDSDDEDEDGDADTDSGTSASKVKLKAWSHRKGRSMGFDAPEGKAVPLIDRIHRLMHMWKAGDQHKVDEYIDEHSLRNNELFKRVVQSLIELSTNSERSLLESISNHIGAKGSRPNDEERAMADIYRKAGYADNGSEE